MARTHLQKLVDVLALLERHLCLFVDALDSLRLQVVQAIVRSFVHTKTPTTQNTTQTRQRQRQRQRSTDTKWQSLEQDIQMVRQVN